jgi:5-methylcytosine-specific restriction endonuclease McrA
VREVLQRVRREEPQFNKDGGLGKKPAVRYQCTICGKWFMGSAVAVDHITPVISTGGTFVDWNEFVKNLFCAIENLQVVCSYKLKDAAKYGGIPSCHHKKTQAERAERKKNDKM